MMPIRFTTALVCAFFSTCNLSGFAGDVIVALHQSSPAVTSQTVHVGDIASVIGGTPSDRRYIEQLDLETLSDQDACTISRNQVQMRLLLAGYRRNAIEVTGPANVTARRSAPARLRSKLEKSLQTEIGIQFGVDADRVSIRLTNDSQLTALEKKFSSNSISVELFPRNEFPIGQTRMMVGLLDPAGIRHTTSLDAQVGLSMKVAIASNPINRGTVIRPEMLRLVDRTITSKADYANPDNTVGRVASRYIGANAVLLVNHLATAPSGTSRSIRRNDLLDVVIRIGHGEIRLKNARAMESGTIGDTIEILNPQSNRRINATIIGENLATVSSNPRRM